MQARQTADANGLALAVRMQLQQLATKLDARLPPSVPAVSPAVLANGPEPRLGTPERIAGDGSQQPPCAPLAVTPHRPTRLATGCGSSPGTCHFWWSTGSCSLQLPRSMGVHPNLPHVQGETGPFEPFYPSLSFPASSMANQAWSRGAWSRGEEGIAWQQTICVSKLWHSYSRPNSSEGAEFSTRYWLLLGYESNV